MTPGADRFAGCLVGQALGDALGFLVEGEPAATCRTYGETGFDADRPPKGRRGPFAYGQYSDDTQLARELLQSYVARGGFEPADYARRVAAIFHEDRIVGRGRATEEAARRLQAGVPWTEAGIPAPSAGNGSAMRAGPVGLMFHDDPDALIRAAHDQGRLTHADPRCSAGAVAVAATVARALDPAPLDPAAVAGDLARMTEPFDAGFAGLLGRLDGLLAVSPEQAAETVAGADPRGVSPFVVPSVLWSLYAFLRHPEAPLDALRLAIRIGGDVDTTAAMTGAMAGARGGLAALPPVLVAPLNDQGGWDAEALADLGRRAWTVKTGRQPV